MLQFKFNFGVQQKKRLKFFKIPFLAIFNYPKKINDLLASKRDEMKKTFYTGSLTNYKFLLLYVAEEI